MNITKRYIILAASFAACTSAMRADDLSELVAAVAASQKTTQQIISDSRIVSFDSLPQYQPKEEPLDLDILSGVCDAMTFHASLDYVLNAFDHSYFIPQINSYESDYWSNRPTLARSGFFRPVPGGITSRFGWRPQFNRMHHGVDLRLCIGDTVRAAIGGTVEKVAYDHDGYGHYVVVRHPDGMETLYGHLQYSLVSQGQDVVAGFPVGIGGNTGNSTGPHLHFEARMGGVPIDPTLIFDFSGKARYLAAENISDTPHSSQSSKSLSGKHTYVVRQGDTPKSIARRAGISVLRLCQLNMIRESDKLQTGRMLKLK